MHKSVKLVSFCICVALLFSFPVISYAADIPVDSAEVQGLADNGEVNTNTGSNGSAIRFGTIIYGRVNMITTNYTFTVTGNAGDVITVDASMVNNGFTGVTGYATLYNSYVDSVIGQAVNGTSFSLTVQLVTDVKDQPMTVSCTLTPQGVRSGYENDYARFGWRMSITRTSETNGLLDTLIDWVQGIFDNLSELPDKISGFFSDLGDDLTAWFEDVGDWFTDLGNDLSAWFSDLGDRISGFFTNLGNSISGFFEKLWNRIYWGNENGASEYDPPVFGSSLDDVLDTLDGYIAQLDDTNQQIQDTTDESVAYVEQGTDVIDTIFGVFPSILTGLVVFGIVFIFCRKVVGR